MWYRGGNGRMPDERAARVCVGHRTPPQGDAFEPRLPV